MPSRAIPYVLGKMAAKRPIRQVVEFGGDQLQRAAFHLPDAHWLAADIWAPPDFAAAGNGGLILFGEGLESVPYYRIGEMAAAAMEHFDIAALTLPIGTGWLIEDISRRFAPTLAALIELGSQAVVFLGRTEEIRTDLAQLVEAFRAEPSQTAGEEFVRQFAELARFLEIGSLADAGCGDFSWMGKISSQFSLYFGLDRDATLIADLEQRFGSRRGHFFAVRDVEHQPLPKVDAILCRDLFEQHSVETVSAMLAQIKASGAKYMLASTTPGAPAPLDLGQQPFNLPLPFLQFAEQPGGTKLLGVWLIPATTS